MKRNRTLLLLMTVAAIIVSACGPAGTAAPQPTQPPAQPTQPSTEPTQPVAPEPTQPPAGAVGVLPEVNPLEVTGDIVTAGSSTVFPLSEAMAARFEDEGYAGNITIDSIGSGAGLERFCVAGETDIANASRAIRA
ncbi:MAG TPA: substrate-binding domain-containing protein, partial [Anaerolineae bacterium]|nr:substrate-binding domain-containing protein [Anaerolineae bacterium]